MLCLKRGFDQDKDTSQQTRRTEEIRDQADRTGMGDSSEMVRWAQKYYLDEYSSSIMNLRSTAMKVQRTDMILFSRDGLENKRTFGESQERRRD